MPRPPSDARPFAVRRRRATAATSSSDSANLAVVALLVLVVLFAYHAPDDAAPSSPAPKAPVAARPNTPAESQPAATGFAREPTVSPVLVQSQTASVSPSTAEPTPASGSSGRVDATVAGAGTVAVLACPAPTCAVQSQLRLGAPVAVMGESVKGFTPIATALGAGYVQDLYLKPVDGASPFLGAGDPGCGRIALIFNIGIGAEPITSILDTLAVERVPATMFVMGWWAEQRPPILERMMRDGYPIGSHGYGQTELTSLTDDEVRQDVRKAAAVIQQATGAPPSRLFTPYAAAIDDRVRALVAAEGYLPVGWEVAAADYGPDATEEAVYERIMSGVHDGAIVELHLDGSASAESTGRALPRVIGELRAQGYRFVTIPEMAETCP